MTLEEANIHFNKLISEGEVFCNSLHKFIQEVDQPGFIQPASAEEKESSEFYRFMELRNELLNLLQ